MNNSTALIITTYNRPETLNLVLQSVAIQTVMPQQILIADDGSSSETRAIVDKFKVEQLPICYCWQSDSTFRAARARNLAISRVECSYTIFIDGDCLLTPNFVENHLNLAEPEKIVAGSRYLFSSEETDRILRNQFYEFTKLSSESIKFLKIPLGIFRDYKPTDWQSVRTCNLSLHTKDVRQIHGFDESYQGWGREDSDFVVRLIRSGLKVRSGRFATCVGHLYHLESNRTALADNENRFHQILQQDRNLTDIKSSLAEV